MPMKPKIFVASSREALRIALAVQQNLEDVADVTVWDQDAFQLGENHIDGLSRILSMSNFGVFVFAPDDVTEMRREKKNTVRDNVILELGMFLGRLGKKKSFIIKPKNEDLHIPADLWGVVMGQYDRAKAQEQTKSALAPVCAQIADILKRFKSGQSKRLNKLVKEALETVCRAMSVPVDPFQVGLRAFIFRREENELVCQHYWDPRPSDEKIDITRFQIDKETASKVVVVRCFLDNQIAQTVATPSRAEVKPIPKKFKGLKGKIKPSLRYVLATPLRKEDGSIWGVIDFDTSTPKGERLLQTDVAQDVMVRLAKHIRSVLRIG